MSDLAFSEIFATGGWVLAAILGVSLLAWVLLVVTWLRLREVVAGLRFNQPVRRLYERYLEPAATAEATALRRPLSFIACLSSVLPLLGLLGTVLGMLETFSALAVVKTVNLSSLADGVSQALITTQAGLLAAVPIILVHNWLCMRTENCIHHATLYVKKAGNIV